MSASAVSAGVQFNSTDFVQVRHCASGAATNNSPALQVAMNVNKLKRSHQTGTGDKKTLESDAWKLLNSLTEDQVGQAEGKSVALLLSSWAYFAKFWEKGKDGPSGA